MNIPEVPGTWWSFYTDDAGHRAVLTTHVNKGAIHLKTSEEELLRFSTTDVDALVTDLSAAAAAARPLGTRRR